MNSTLWNSTEEALGHFGLSGLIFLTYFYSIYLSYAIHDYQNEKPIEEKSPIDIHIKDIHTITICLLRYFGFIQFISVFLPAVTCRIVYLISHMSVFLSNLYIVSWLVYLYIQYLYIFYPDHIKEIPVSIIRLRSFLWKLFLTMISMIISTICPLENQPIMFQFLAKGKQYDRYTLYFIMISNYISYQVCTYQRKTTLPNFAQVNILVEGHFNPGHFNPKLQPRTFQP